MANFHLKFICINLTRRRQWLVRSHEMEMLSQRVKENVTKSSSIKVKVILCLIRTIGCRVSFSKPFMHWIVCVCVMLFCQSISIFVGNQVSHMLRFFFRAYRLSVPLNVCRQTRCNMILNSQSPRKYLSTAF